MPEEAQAPAAPNPNLFRDTIRQQVSAIPAPAEQVVETPAEPVIEEQVPPAAPVEETPADPLKEISKPDAPEIGKLPIDDDEPAAEENAPKEKLDSLKKAGHRIEEVKREVKEVWKPKVAELEQVKAQLETRIAELEARAAQAEELEGKVKSYEDEISVVRLEKHPKYVQEVATPLRARVAEATALAEKYDIPSDELLDAMEIENDDEAQAAIEKLTSGLDVKSLDLLKMLKIRDGVRPLLAKREEMYANAEKVLAELEVANAESAKKASLARADERRQVAPTVAERIAAKVPFLKDNLSGLVDQTVATDLESLDSPNKVYNHLAGLALPKMVNEYAAIKAENDRLLDEIASIKKALPGSQTGFSTSAGDDSPKNNFAQVIKEGMARM